MTRVVTLDVVAPGKTGISITTKKETMTSRTLGQGTSRAIKSWLPYLSSIINIKSWTFVGKAPTIFSSEVD